MKLWRDSLARWDFVWFWDYENSRRAWGQVWWRSEDGSGPLLTITALVGGALHQRRLFEVWPDAQSVPRQ